MDYSNWNDLNRMHDIFMDANQRVSAVIDISALDLSEEETRAFFEPAWPSLEKIECRVSLPEEQGWSLLRQRQVSQIPQSEQVEAPVPEQQPREIDQEVQSPWIGQTAQKVPQHALEQDASPSSCFVQYPVFLQQPLERFNKEGQQPLFLQRQALPKQSAQDLTPLPTDPPPFQSEVLTALLSAEQKMLVLLEKIRATRARVEFAQSVGRDTIKEMNLEKAEKLIEYLEQRARAIVDAAKGLEERVYRVVAEVNR